jgi:hypothetical protein
MLIDSPQDADLWGILGAVYGFRNGEIDDRTGEIFCPARDEYLVTLNSQGEEID